MRRTASPLVRFAAMSWVLIVPACYSLPKVDVIRVVDDFVDGGPYPSWSAFEPWTCGLYLDPRQAGDAGLDAGLDGGTDAGQAWSCYFTRVPGDVTDDSPLFPPGTMTQALVVHFSLTTPSELEVATQTESTPPVSADALPTPIPVNLTTFRELLFNAKLTSTPGAVPLSGTEVHVQLRCSSISDALEDTSVMLPIDVANWKPIILPFSDFKTRVRSQHQACLAAVDSIAFVVVPGMGTVQAGTRLPGTLQLDDIRLQ